MKATYASVAWVFCASLLVCSPGFAQREDKPQTGSAPQRLTSRGDNLKPCVAVRPGGGLYLAWAKKDEVRADIMFARSSNGIKLDEQVRITTPGMFLDLGAENGPDIAIDSKGAIYVVWVAGSTPAAPRKERPANRTQSTTGEKPRNGGHPPRPANLSIWISRSDNDGASFSPPVKVNGGPDGPERRFPTVRVDSRDGVCVAWLDKRKTDSDGEAVARLYFARSMDGGRTFEREVDGTAGQPDPICHCCRVSLAMHPRAGLTIAFRNDISDLRDMFLVRSEDEGRSFSAPEHLEKTGWRIPNCPMDGPSIAFDRNGILHGAWMTGGTVNRKPLWGKVEPGDTKVLYSRRASESRTVEQPMLLGAGHHPRIALGPNGEAYVVWRADSVMLVKIGPGTDEAAAPIRLSDDKGAPSYPSIALDGKGTLYCAWQQLMPDDSVQIYLKRLTTKQPGDGRGIAGSTTR